MLLCYANRGELPDRCSGSDGSLYEKVRKEQATGECSDPMNISQPARKIAVDNQDRLRYLDSASVRLSHVSISRVMATAGTFWQLTFFCLIRFGKGGPLSSKVLARALL